MTSLALFVYIGIRVNICHASLQQQRNDDTPVLSVLKIKIKYWVKTVYVTRSAGISTLIGQSMALDINT